MSAIEARRATALEELKQLLGERLTTSEAVRAHHGQSEGYAAAAAPDAVAFVESTAEVAAIVRICGAQRVPIIAYGAGTSLEGHIAAPFGGITLDFGRMNQAVAFHPEDLDVTVQAGMTRLDLNAYVRDAGLFFPLDPGANATIGGMAATRASGTNAVRYGTMRENVLGVTAVMADGSIVRTAQRARKSAAGYDLTRLLVGSEGTLGIMTEVTVRLFGVPEAISSAVCPFDTLAGAVETVMQVIQLGIPVARVEILDEVQLGACNRYSGLDLPVKPTLFFEFHGTARGVREDAERTQELAAANGGPHFQWTVDEAERKKLWKARHDAYFAVKAMRPGCAVWPTDVCVPISALARCILETRADIDRDGMLAPIVGHVGDGNFHVSFVIDPTDERELERAKRLNEAMVKRALALGGTCTGEHGIGLGKREALVAELGADTVAVMRAIKHALDPLELLNPGKVFLAEA
jgi:D-lactate dehydrogenase (cytochrome)